jgi:hypothetical protein
VGVWISWSFLFVVFAMGQNRPDIDLEPVVMDHSDQPEFVFLDVEDGEFAHGIGMGKVSSRLVNVVPLGSSGNSIP